MAADESNLLLRTTRVRLNTELSAEAGNPRVVCSFSVAGKPRVVAGKRRRLPPNRYQMLKVYLRHGRGMPGWLRFYPMQVRVPPGGLF